MGITPGPERGPVGNIEICLIAFVNEMSIFSIYIYIYIYIYIFNILKISQDHLLFSNE